MTESRKDGYCDYHPLDRAAWICALASPQGDQVRGRMLCDGCMTDIFSITPGSNASRAQGSYIDGRLADGEIEQPGSIAITHAAFFPYSEWRCERRPPGLADG